MLDAGLAIAKFLQSTLHGSGPIVVHVGSVKVRCRFL